MEKTLAILKPDAVERNLIGKILERIEGKGFKVAAMRMAQLSQCEAKGFYDVHKERPFFGSLVSFMTSGPVVLMVLEGEGSVLKNRDIMGATNPEDAEEGTIRKRYGISIDKNSVHGSDSVENAKIEIDFFFKD